MWPSLPQWSSRCPWVAAQCCFLPLCPWHWAGQRLPDLGCQDRPPWAWGRGGLSPQRRPVRGGRVAAFPPVHSPVRREDTGATALARSLSSHHPEPLEQGDGACGTPGWLGACAGGRVQKGPACPSLAGHSQASAQGGRPASGVSPLPAAAGPPRPVAFVSRGHHEMAASARRHFVSGRRRWPAEGRGSGRPPGGRASTAPALPRPGRAPGLAPASGQRAGGSPGARPLAPPGLAPPDLCAPRTRCCSPGSGRAVIKATPLGESLAASGR